MSIIVLVHLIKCGQKLQLVRLLDYYEVKV